MSEGGSRRAHEDAITEHTTLLAHTAESLRREILPIAILASNFVNEARKAHANLTTVIEFSIRYLDKDSLKQVDGGVIDIQKSLPQRRFPFRYMASSGNAG